MNYVDTDKLKYVKAINARKIYKVSDATLSRWRSEDKIKYIKKPSGQYLYAVPGDSADDYGYPNSIEKGKICYCRVSSKKQKDDLERQVEYMRSRYPNYTIITDIGSGLNWRRSGLKTILGQTMSQQLEEVVVAHRDRLCRFAFELIEWIMAENKVKLVVLDREVHSTQDELATDLLSIIHVFSCREMGKRRYTKRQIKGEKNCDNTEEIISREEGDSEGEN